MRILAAIIVFVLFGVTGWNFVGRISLPDIDGSYRGSILEGAYSGTDLNEHGAALVRDWIENRTRPSLDPIKILLHQGWYNAVTKGYDLKVWVEPLEYDAAKEQYAVYQYDNVILLRIEYSRRNRVLITDFSAAEFEEALQPYVMQ